MKKYSISPCKAVTEVFLGDKGWRRKKYQALVTQKILVHRINSLFLVVSWDLLIIIIV